MLVSSKPSKQRQLLGQRELTRQIELTALSLLTATFKDPSFLIS
jgi:hypothetical protein